jgi:hypothetical protein
MAFISTAIIDTFDRPDAATLGLQWGPTVISGTDFSIVSGRARAGAAPSTCASLWQPLFPGGDMEAWVDVHVLSTGAGTFQLYLALLGRSPVPLSSTNPWIGGYGIQYRASTNELYLVSFRVNSVTTLTSGVTWTYPLGTRIGIARINGQIRGYTWTPDAGPTQILAFNPALTGDGLVYGGPGRIGLECFMPAGTASPEFDNFGGGETPFEVISKKRHSRMTSWK